MGGENIRRKKTKKADGASPSADNNGAKQVNEEHPEINRTPVEQQASFHQNGSPSTKENIPGANPTLSPSCQQDDMTANNIKNIVLPEESPAICATKTSNDSNGFLQLNENTPHGKTPQHQPSKTRNDNNNSHQPTNSGKENTFHPALAASETDGCRHKTETNGENSNKMAEKEQHKAVPETTNQEERKNEPVNETVPLTSDQETPVLSNTKSSRDGSHEQYSAAHPSLMTTASNKPVGSGASRPTIEATPKDGDELTKGSRKNDGASIPEQQKQRQVPKSPVRKRASFAASVTDSLPKERLASDALGRQDSITSFSSHEEEQRPSLPEIVSIRGGLRHKAGLLDVGAWVKLSLTLDGRDKITKVFQYTARFLAWYLLGSKQAERFESLKKSLGNGRKAFRLGRTLVEFHRLQTVGLLETLQWHWKRSSLGKEDVTEEESQKRRPAARPPLLRRVSTNIGLNYVSTMEVVRSMVVQSPLMVRQLSRLSSRIFRTYASTESGASGKSIWPVLMTAIKLFGLGLYFAGDNISFLASSGFCDNYTLAEKERMSGRKQLISKATEYGNRAYFAAALAGLTVSWKNYSDYCRQTNQRLARQQDGDEEACDMDKAQEKQFALFISLLKSCCDVVVFSNNPGIDLWKNHLGYPMNEGVHCVAGLISACAVLFSNYPNSC